MYNNQFNNFHLDNGAGQPPQRRVQQQAPCFQIDAFKDSIHIRLNNEMAMELLNTVVGSEQLDPNLAEIFHEIKTLVGIKQIEVIVDDSSAEEPFVVGRFRSGIFVVITHETLKRMVDVLNNVQETMLSSTYSLKQKCERILYQPPNPHHRRPNYY
jgi:hypothetical protein